MTLVTAQPAGERGGSISEVTVVLADRFPNYSICGLPFYLSGEVPDWTAEDLTREGIHLLL